jgi:hypothetical protein
VGGYFEQSGLFAGAVEAALDVSNSRPVPMNNVAEVRASLSRQTQEGQEPVWDWQSGATLAGPRSARLIEIYSPSFKVYLWPPKR